MSYEEPADNEWVTPIRAGYKMACCDCGLVHDMDFRVVGPLRRRVIQFRVRRNNRSTAAMRLHRNITVEHEDDE